jgi:hypothetical protein
MTAHLVQQLASTKVKGALKERAQRKNVKLRHFFGFYFKDNPQERSFFVMPPHLEIFT